MKNLEDINIKWTDKKSLCVVLCSKGYPETFEKNVVIKNFN
jgi:phosphoribosylamine--glycine ligase